MIRNIVKKDEKAENFFLRITATTRTVRWSLFLDEEGIHLECFGTERVDGRVQTFEFIQ